MSTLWKKGRGKLGVFKPLLGAWVAETNSDMGPVRVERTFCLVLGGKFVRLNANWTFANSSYEELALFGPDADGSVSFWSYTSDGKRSNGSMTVAPDIHATALAFEATMPAGVARQVYWPDQEDGFRWVVESQTKKGWRRFLEHHYVARET